MKKTMSLLAFVFSLILITISCSQNSEQPNSPADSNSPIISGSIQNNGGPNEQNGKFGIIGAFFGKEEADIIYGKVKTSVTISTDELNAAIDKGNKYILIAIIKGKIVILGEKKEYLSNEHVAFNSNETFHILSKSMIKELLKAKKSSSFSLSKSTADAVAVELRPSVLSLTYNDLTLERTTPCPPFCGD
ncbi:MAG: hypothetical protein CVV24_09740 [Ignavibacteriae bacterium HGW-Ignavibacteriae-3]|nr:MAG: hypothetical protein CVV24_09740 [Ignavibacteriae bacterium HGW-Ignavibacteriae-3]